jgi:hypothetical protein
LQQKELALADHYYVDTLYLQKKGRENTAAVLAHAAKRAKELGLGKVLIATCTGYTAEQALNHFDLGQTELVAVTHVTGFAEPNVQEMPDEVRERLAAQGIKVLTAAHAFGGVGRGIRAKLNTFQVDEIMAHTLRMLGQGVKVGLEMAYMAADRGWVRTDEDVLTIAGTGRGADTAVVLQPANSHNCLDAKVREIIAKPRNP